MALSKNSIIGIVNSQKNLNMQSHMRGYVNSNEIDYKEIDEKYKREELKKNFDHFLYNFCNFVYPTESLSLSKDKEDGFNKFMEDRYVDMNLVAEYLENANEELLNDPNFGNSVAMKHLGDQIRLIEGLHHSSDRVITSMSYIAGTMKDDPNIIRIGITKNSNDGLVIINGNIDICSDGQILIHTFEKEIYHIKWDTSKHSFMLDENGNIVYDIEKIPADIKDTPFDIEHLGVIRDYFMQLYELADLKTKNSNIHR